MRASRIDYRRRILRVQLYIQDHLDQDLRADQLARLAHFSSFHFHRIFKGIVGEGIAEYVRRLRLEHAGARLRAGDASITAIGRAAGYDSQEAFCRAFRGAFGVSPSEFRRRSRSMLAYRQFSKQSPAETERTVEIKELPAKRVAFVRHVGPYPDCVPTFERFVAWAYSHRIYIAGRTQIIGVYHDDPEITPADKLRYDCCLTVDESFTERDDVKVKALDGGAFAVLTHRGSHDGLAEAYQWLYGAWLPSNGYRLRDAPPFEVYQNVVPRLPPERLVTEIHVPLATGFVRRRSTPDPVRAAILVDP
jgi:AraC family transcriptional regulator